MHQIKPQNDTRYDNICCYCQNQIIDNKTRDHVPSKILLEEPFPENLPIIYCCYDCNQSFSTDEEYFACMIEYICSETKDINLFERQKITEILNKKTHLRKRIENNIEIENEIIKIKLEEKPINNVLKKLLYGHLSFELSNPYIENWNYIRMDTLDNLTQTEIDLFFENKSIDKSPEIGSRLSLVITLNNNIPISNWKIVQNDFYQYKIDINAESTCLKILIRNKICIIAEWITKNDI